MTPKACTRVLIAGSGLAAVLAGPHLLGSGRAAAATSAAQVVSNVTYGTDPGTVLDEYLPATAAPTATPAVIFIHGGAWAHGDKNEWAADAKDLVAQTGWAAFSINYDMNTSEAYYEVEPRDVTAALNWVKSNASQFNIDPSRIAFVGDSAGGQLAMSAATTGTGPSSGPGRVEAVVSWSGIADFPLVTKDAGCYSTFCPNTNGTATQWLGWASEGYNGWTVASAQPARWAADSAVDQVDPTDPKMLLFNSTNEMVPIDQMQEMEAKLAGSNIPVQAVSIPGTGHALDYNSTAWPTTLFWLEHSL